MERLTLLQMVADDGSSAPVNEAAEALDRLAGQALALDEARRQIAEMQREIDDLKAHNQRLTGMLESRTPKEIL